MKVLYSSENVVGFIENVTAREHTIIDPSITFNPCDPRRNENMADVKALEHSTLKVSTAILPTFVS